MKSFSIVSMLIVLSSGSLVGAQTVANRAPVLVPAQYVTSSSPLGDGRFVTTYRASTVSQPTYSLAQPRVVYRTVATPQFAQPQVVYRPAGASYYGATVAPVQYNTTANAADFAPQLPPTTVQSTPTLVSGAATPYACSPSKTIVGYAPVAYGGQTAYRPIIPTQNVKPGSYLGRGLLGQPKAFVQGQPLRNLFRFMLP